VGPRALWMDVENLAPTGIRSSDRPDRSESLYRLSYPGPDRGKLTLKIKLQLTLKLSLKAQRRSRGTALTLFNLDAAWGVGSQRHAHAILPPVITWYPLRMSLDDLNGCGKFPLHRNSIPGLSSSPQRSRYTDCAVPAHLSTRQITTQLHPILLRKTKTPVM
jgi:hypothetical protein